MIKWIDGENGAYFSDDRVYRYALWRIWGEGPLLMVVGLNPSTADERNNDPTVRRCIGYARLWGYAGLLMMNAYSYRATDPALMERASRNEPNWESNHQVNLDYLRYYGTKIVTENGAVLAAWGNHISCCSQGYQVKFALSAGPEHVSCLGINNTGEPKHPLYLRADAKPVAYLGNGGKLCGQ